MSITRLVVLVFLVLNCSIKILAQEISLSEYKIEMPEGGYIMNGGFDGSSFHVLAMVVENKNWGNYYTDNTLYLYTYDSTFKHLSTTKLDFNFMNSGLTSLGYFYNHFYLLEERVEGYECRQYLLKIDRKGNVEDITIGLEDNGEQILYMCKEIAMRKVKYALSPDSTKLAICAYNRTIGLQFFGYDLISGKLATHVSASLTNEMLNTGYDARDYKLKSLLVDDEFTFTAMLRHQKDKKYGRAAVVIANKQMTTSKFINSPEELAIHLTAVYMNGQRFYIVSDQSKQLKNNTKYTLYDEKFNKVDEILSERLFFRGGRSEIKISLPEYVDGKVYVHYGINEMTEHHTGSGPIFTLIINENRKLEGMITSRKLGWGCPDGNIYCTIYKDKILFDAVPTKDTRVFGGTELMNIFVKDIDQPDDSAKKLEIEFPTRTIRYGAFNRKDILVGYNPEGKSAYLFVVNETP